MISIITKIKEYLLRQELKSGFIIGGYNDSMVRVLGKRFLNDREVKIVHRWRSDNKLINAGTSTVTSTNGNVYVDKIYKTV